MQRPDAPRSNLRCAIYTRKSTEEGLEQDFNSLDAQREACRAYVMSQQHEGWKLDDALYDDGGYSGGSMDRPALQQLLDEVRAGRIDVIVVYKVDRLTRSLADFAKIVEIMDEAGASFVSVTQSFNTTTSMGRLTLNVLLSFAQFEREVTGERIRDKIAASKKKGIWMGGPVPLGYRLENRKLLVDDREAAQVQTIFREYLQVGSLRRLGTRLQQLGLRTKARIYKSGRRVGGCAFTRGGLQHLLRNRIYRGMIVHKGKAWPGEHDAIIDQELWEQVQSQLDSAIADKKSGARAHSPSLLAGLLFDEHGRRLVPSHATKGTRRYRYYSTAAGDSGEANPPAVRLPARDIEKVVEKRLASFLHDRGELADRYGDTAVARAIETAKPLTGILQDGSPSELRELLSNWIQRIDVKPDAVEIALQEPDPIGSPVANTPLSISCTTNVEGSGSSIVIGESPESVTALDHRLVDLVANAFLVRERVVAGEAIADIAEEMEHAPQWIGRLIRIGWLSPELVESIVDGRQPPGLTRRVLSGSNFSPTDWMERPQNEDGAISPHPWEDRRAPSRSKRLISIDRLQIH